MTPAEDEMPSAAPDLSAVSTPGLFRFYSSILIELHRRKVVRSTNNPVADYAECLTAHAFNLELAGKSETGYDARDRGGLRYQVKARRLTSHNKSRQLGFIRHLGPGEEPFDYLVGILFDVNFAVTRAVLIPLAVVRERVAWAEPVKAWRLILSDSTWALPGVQDITASIRKAAAQIDEAALEDAGVEAGSNRIVG